jgi:hypothetical protein
MTEGMTADTAIMVIKVIKVVRVGDGHRGCQPL